MTLPKTHWVTTPDGAELWCELSGAGEHTVALADGLGCDGFIWKYLKPALERHYKVVRFHYRGHGKSSLGADPNKVSVELFADDLAQILGELAISRAAIFGHSMGVQVILEFHRRHPELTCALVPVCGSYGNVLDTWHDDTKLKTAFPYLHGFIERAPILSRRIWSRVVPTELALFIGRHFEANPDFLSPDDFRPYFSHLAAMDPLAFARTLQGASTHSAESHLKNVDVPTLILAGERDRFTPVWLSERMHEDIEGSELVVMPRATHCAPLEMPQLADLAVERFLAERAFAAEERKLTSPA